MQFLKKFKMDHFGEGRKFGFRSKIVQKDFKGVYWFIRTKKFY